MENETPAPQQEQEQDTVESAPVLRPWVTPRLMRLNHAGDGTAKLFSNSESTILGEHIGPS